MNKFVPDAQRLLMRLNEHIGARIRCRREGLSISVQDLATAFGVTCAAVAAIEESAVSLRSNDLYRLSHILSVPVGWFYQEAEVSAALLHAPLVSAQPPPGA